MEQAYFEEMEELERRARHEQRNQVRRIVETSMGGCRNSLVDNVYTCTSSTCMELGVAIPVRFGHDWTVGLYFLLFYLFIFF